MFCFVEVRSVLTEKTMFDNASLMFTSIFISKSQKYWLMLTAFANTQFFLSKLNCKRGRKTKDILSSFKSLTDKI